MMVRVLGNKARLYMEISKYDSARFYISIANEIVNDPNKGFPESMRYEILSSYAEILYKNGKADTAELLSKRVLNYGLKTNDSALLFRSNGNLGMYYGTKGKFASAIDYLRESLKYTSDELDVTVAYIRMAAAFLNMGKPQKALETNRKALRLVEIHGFNNKYHLKHIIFNNMGRAHDIDNNLDSALYYYAESVKLKQSKGLDDGLAISFINIGNIHYSRKDFERALEYYLRSLNNPNIENMPRAHAAVTINLGLIYTELNETEKAAYYFEQGLSLATKYKLRQFRQNAFGGLVELDSIRGNYLNSMRYKDSVLAITERLWDDKLSDRLAELEAESNLKSKTLENELLRKRDKANQKRLLYQKIALGLAGLIVIGIIIFLVFIYRGRARLETMYNKLEAKSEQIKQKNEQLEELNRTKDKFFSIISHDLKGPIGTLIALLEELEDDYDSFDEEERKDIIHNLRSSGQNTYNMLVNLLDWSRSQRGAINNTPQDTDLYEIVDDVIGVLKERALKKSITLKNSMAKDEVISYVDPEMIRTVFINLINNAIKFSHEHGIVEIGGARSNGLITVFVKDKGIGIPAEMMESLFKLNTDYQRRGTRNEKGTGLGLVLCHEFVLKMGGRITVKSSESKGSTFKITLPAKPNKTRIETIA